MIKRDLNISLAAKMIKKIRPFWIYLPKMTAYRRDFDKTKYMSFLIKDDKLLEKCNEIWETVRNGIRKEFDSDPVYNQIYLKAKIKSYNWKISTNIHNNKIPKEGSQCICLSIILIDSIFKTGSNYYPQLFLEECKYVIKKRDV